MRRIRIAWKRWPLAAAVFLLAGLPSLAHEKWFIDPKTASGVRPEVFLSPTVFGVAAFAAASVLFILAWAIDRKYDGSALLHRLDGKIAAWKVNPRTILIALIGVSLMGAGLQGTLFAPNLHLPDTALGAWIGVFEIALGTALLFLEPYAPELGLALGALFLTGFLILPPMDLLEELLIMACAVLFVTAEKDRLPWKRLNTPEVRRLGYQAFRVLVGVGFLVLASVKWIRPDLGLAVVREYGLNFMGWAGVDAAGFVFLAAVVETFVALCILFRVAYRPAIALAFIFFTLSIYFLGPVELLGHLPIKGALFLMFVYGHWHKGEIKDAPPSPLGA